ncbi:MAG: [FeFe] hydrogenase H-cluster maturation GTPase HydF [bacterium]
MQGTPKGLRLQIGIFGRRNVGKSSLLNALTRQSVSIVSEIAGTTTDPVEKAMELQPLGPVLFVDTAGVDDVGALGELRVAGTMKVVERTDLAILVTDDWQDFETRLLALFLQRKTPVVVAANKSDHRAAGVLEAAARAAGAKTVVTVSAVTRTGLDAMRQAIITATPEDYLNAPALLGDLVPPGALVVLVVPIDIEAPKGRLILPQVQTLRDILDQNGYAMVVKERELAHALARLNQPPALVVTDSQEFLKVISEVPASIPVTGFSILFARFKGDLAELVRGASAIDRLKPGDRVLVAEACTHHPTGEDIGRVKIPRWLEQYVGGKLDIVAKAGCDYPDDIAGFNLIVHCGACMWNRRQMLSRIAQARAAGVPITNYGLTIAHSLGILDRALSPFPYAKEAYRVKILD